MSNLPPEEQSFEEALAELERTVRELEEGRLGLDDALARYEQGVGLLRHCYERLRVAEQRISVLAGLDEEGRPVLAPFEHEATAGRDGSPRRGRKRGEQLQ
jgi:exodeoxyribonuclease VII small subunit